MSPACNSTPVFVTGLFWLSLFLLPALGDFNWNNPPGPQFTNVEIEEQVRKGKSLLPEVRESFLANSSSHTIAPGNYRWLLPDNESEYQVTFENMHRTADRPFVIIASDVTFWIALREPNGTLHASFGVLFVNCSNIHVVGLTIDSHPRGVIDGRVIDIDTPHNRLLLALSNGSYPFKPYVANPKAHNFLRFLPYKSDGNFMTPLYAFQVDRGIYLSHLGPLDENRQFWAYFKNDLMLTRTATQGWKDAYGDGGILQVDDGLSILVTRSKMLELVNCDSLVFESLTNYVAKGTLHVTSGEGHHIFRNTVFSRRPNTNQLYGGDGVMINAVRHGPLFDNFQVTTSSDDIINFHSYWGYIKSVYDDIVEFEKSQFNLRTTAVLRPGDQAVFYNKDTMEKLGTATVVECTSIEKIRFNVPTKTFAGGIAFFPQLACDNWTIINSHFRDCYQRVLIQSGSGTFVNNTLTRVGSCVMIRSTTSSHNEGGIPHDIIVANNTFIDVSTGPFLDKTLSSPIHIGMSREPKLPIYTNIDILNNVIIRPGDTGINVWTASAVMIGNNTLIDPHYYTYKADNQTDGHPQGIFVAGSQDIVVDSNTVVDSQHVCTPDKKTGSIVLGLGEKNFNITFNGNPVSPSSSLPWC